MIEIDHVENYLNMFIRYDKIVSFDLYLLFISRIKYEILEYLEHCYVSNIFHPYM